MKVELPWPPSAHNPNSRKHWAVKRRAAEKYRQECWALTYQAAKGRKIPDVEPGSIDLYIDFYPPDRGRRDDDNLVAAFKSGRDGLADALGCDDRVFRIHPFLHDEVRRGGVVVVTIYGSGRQ